MATGVILRTGNVFLGTRCRIGLLGAVSVSLSQRDPAVWADSLWWKPGCIWGSGDSGGQCFPPFEQDFWHFLPQCCTSWGVWWDGCVRWASRGVKLWLDDGVQRLCLVPSTLHFLETAASGGGISWVGRSCSFNSSRWRQAVMLEWNCSFWLKPVSPDFKTCMCFLLV